MKRLIKSMVALGVTLGIIGQMVPLQASTIVPKEYPGLSISVFKGSNVSSTAITNYTVAFNETINNEQQRIFSEPVTIESGAKANIGVKGKALESQQYQIIKSIAKPIFSDIDETKWKTLGEIPKNDNNDIGSYPDLLLNKQGYISTKHYNYKYDSTEFNANQIPPRATTFGYPIGANMAIQTANVNAGNQYYNTEDKGAFFANSKTGITTLKTSYIAPKTGTYIFSVRSNSGADGYITVDGVKTIIANDRATAPSTTLPTYHTTYKEVALKEGATYTINMVWEHKAAAHNAPRLEYQVKGTGETSYSKVAVIPAECFEDEEYVGGANKAVKFWGYIVPDKTGNFNLGSYSDDGAYGYIISGGKQVVFVDNWELKPAYDRSGVNNVRANIYLEKGKAYPIYMEWYEGCPVDKAFYPRITVAGSSSWSNIPSNWFYASSDTTPGDQNEAYFQLFEKTTPVDFGTDPGTYYVAVKVKSLDGTVRKLLNGPFKIKGTSEIVTTVNTPDANKIVPESMSNIFYQVKFDEDSIKIKHEVDLSSIINATIGSTSAMNFDVNKVIVTLKTDSGTKTLTAAEVQYNTSSKKLNINLTDPIYDLDKDKVHVINIYLPTTFVAGVKYGSVSGYESYTDKLLNTSINVILKVTATPYYKEKLDESGNVVTAPYNGVEETSPPNSITLTYKPMTKVL